MRRSTPIRLTDEQRRLVEDNVALVGYVMSRYGHQGLGFCDDTFQTGIIGLMRAAVYYDSARSAFSTFAVKCILNELRREARYQQHPLRGGGIRFLSLDLLLPGEDQATVEATLSCAEPDIAERIYNADLVRWLRGLLRGDGSRAARITLDFYSTLDSQREVGLRHNVSQVCASNSIRKMTHWLQRQVAASGERWS